MNASGLILLALDTGRILLLLRTDGLWSFPGGYMDHGEHPVQTALRELQEETGYSGPIELDASAPAAVVLASRERPRGAVPPLRRRGAAFVYTAYLAFVPEEFRARLSAENAAARWVEPLDLPAMTLHPGVLPALSAARGSARAR